jgi:hypothetical protein
MEEGGDEIYQDSFRRYELITSPGIPVCNPVAVLKNTRRLS